MKCRHLLAPTLIAFIAASLTACAVSSPAPELVAPGDYATYVHPSGVFSLDLPRDWIINDTSDPRSLNVEFSPPQAPEPVLTVFVINAAVLNPAAIVDPDAASSSAGYDFEMLAATYQTLYHGAPGAIYKEMDRSLQPDGSLRIVSVLDTPGGPVQFNDFVQVVGYYFVALHARLPAEPGQLRTLDRVINTLNVSQTANWMSDISIGPEQSVASEDVIGFTGVNAWETRTGGYVIAGQIVNNSPGALEFVRINAQFYDAQNHVMAEKEDFVPSDVVLPSEVAPFAIAFPDGLPDGAVRYELHASARYADFAARNFYGPENLGLVSQADFGDGSLLTISGTVRNDGTRTASLVKVIITIFDEQQRVTGAETTLVDRQTLAPGESAGFSVTFVDLGGTPSTFQVTAQGVINP